MSEKGSVLSCAHFISGHVAPCTSQGCCYPQLPLQPQLVSFFCVCFPPPPPPPPPPRFVHIVVFPGGEIQSLYLDTAAALQEQCYPVSLDPVDTVFYGIPVIMQEHLSTLSRHLEKPTLLFFNFQLPKDL